MATAGPKRNAQLYDTGLVARGFGDHVQLACVCRDSDGIIFRAPCVRHDIRVSATGFLQCLLPFLLPIHG